MKYCVIGAGGVGGCIAAYMARAGKDVTAIARGAHLEVIRERGIRIEHKDNRVRIDAFASGKKARKLPPKESGGQDETAAWQPLKACTQEEYREMPDVVFVCVKGYSLDGIVPFIRRIAGKNTIVIPILNLYGTGAKLQALLPDVLVTDGCVYIAAQIEEPGVILLNGDIFRVVFGVREPGSLCKELFEVVKDLRESGIEAILSEDIRRDAFQKFSYISPMAAAGLYFDADAGRFQVTGEERDTFVELMRELEALAEAMGICFQVDIVRNHLAILDALSPGAGTSVQRDIAAGRESEIDGLLFEVIRLGEKYGVEMPVYRRIAQEVERKLRGQA